MKWLEVAGSIASIIALLLTLLIWFRIRAIQRRFMFQARLPELIQSLQRNAVDLSRCLKKIKGSRREINTIFTTCESTLRNLTPKLGGDSRAEAKRLAHIIRTLAVPLWKRTQPNWRAKHPHTADFTWEIYNKLQALIQKLQHVSSDVHWRS